LIRGVASANPRTVVVIMAGAAVTMEDWRQDVPAVLISWYPGMEGGSALADVLLGTSEPGGRLPIVIPRGEGDLPPFDKNATAVTYDRWHGQRLLDRDGIPPAYAVGFGLSYTTFTISDGEAEIVPETGTLAVSANVENTGARPGSHVVQVYASRTSAAFPGIERVLLDFARVDLPARARERVRLNTPLLRLSTRQAPGHRAVQRGEYRIDIASYAGDPNAVSLSVQLA
jgi:beta-glucosidase